MIRVRITGGMQLRVDLSSKAGLVGDPNSPQLAIPWVDWREEFLSSVLVFLLGPPPPKEFLGEPYFRDCCIEQRSPKFAFVVALAFQALLILFPPPLWNVRPAPAEALSSQTELTWYGPIKDLPAIQPALPLPKARPRTEAPETPPAVGADSFHPRQTIISEPLHPNHPRQTLIQPAAPPEPPKILPQLPNIVQLAGSEPARPKLQLTAEQLAALRPKAPESLVAQAVSVPELSTPERIAGEINIASSAQAPLKPALSVSPISAPRATQQRGDADASAPEIAQPPTADSATLIALSATPAPVAPPPSPPAGNLAARISISPAGSQPGVPGGIADGKGANAGPASGGGNGPEGIFISVGNRPNAAPNSGSSIGSALLGATNPFPSRPAPRVIIPPRDSNPLRLNSESAQETPKLDQPPEKVLGSKRVYTLHVNMPNLTSASGSWVLNFAELDDLDAVPYSRPLASDLAGPVPMHKVDPKYPPELRTAHVEGEVILYAIIRKDGTVDSIQLVHGVEAHLDANAMEALAQWKFQPAEKHGEPIDLEAVVHIPFRSRAPAF